MAKRNEISETINDWALLKATARTRFGKRGAKERVTLSVKSQSVTVITDKRILGGPVAQAIRDTLRAQIQGITTPASEETQLRRAYAEGAYKRGKPWARRQYAGGRSKARAPNSRPGGYLFNDSGRMSEGLAVAATTKGDWIINVPANRLKRSDFRAGHFDAMIHRLVAHVPGLRDPRTLYSIPVVQESLDKAVSEMAIVHSDSGRGAAERLAKSLADLGKELGEVGGELADLAETGDDE